jgi:hypothetical protein
MSNNRCNLVLLAVVFLMIVNCNYYEERKTIEIKRGALACVEEIGYGAAGTHGGKGWVRIGFDILVNGKKWLPDDYGEFMKDTASCETSPEKSLEILKFVNVDFNKGGIYLLRLKNGKPELQKISEKHDSKNQGKWTNDGRWLLFQDHFIDVETGERKNIKRLPDAPESNFLGVSPDLHSIVYRESGFLELNQNGSDEQWKTWQANVENGILALWVIDAETGEVKVVKLKRDDYRWLLDKSHPIPETGANHLWISNQFKWEQDTRGGKYRLVYPK